MYLSMLTEEHKHIFLGLELYMSKIDGDFSEDEKRIIKTHCIEMHIDDGGYNSDMALDNIINTIKEDFSIQEKRIVFLELAATVLADGVYDDSEKKLIEYLANVCEMKKEDVDNVFCIVNRIKEDYKNCADFILGE